MKELGKRILFGLPEKAVIFYAMVGGLMVIIRHLLKNFYLDLKDNL